MTTANESPELALLRRCFEEMSAGDFNSLKRVLAEDARWIAVEEGAECEGREMILEVMRRNLAGRVRGSIEEMVQHGPRVLAGFRPERPAEAPNRPLERGIAYAVVTFEGGQITELRGCADRAAALAYAEGGTLP